MVLYSYLFSSYAMHVGTNELEMIPYYQTLSQYGPRNTLEVVSGRDWAIIEKDEGMVILAAQKEMCSITKAPAVTSSMPQILSPLLNSLVSVISLSDRISVTPTCSSISARIYCVEELSPCPGFCILSPG